MNLDDVQRRYDAGELVADGGLVSVTIASSYKPRVPSVYGSSGWFYVLLAVDDVPEPDDSPINDARVWRGRARRLIDRSGQAVPVSVPVQDAEVADTEREDG